MTKTISFKFKNTPEDQAFAKALLWFQGYRIMKTQENHG